MGYFPVYFQGYRILVTVVVNHFVPLLYIITYAGEKSSLLSMASFFSSLVLLPPVQLSNLRQEANGSF